MDNVSQPKVFEFAKEIGMETLTLMDKIREWKLPVRSHMAELDADLLGQIKARLLEEAASKSGDASKKKKVVKKAAAPKEAAPAPAAKKTATKKAAAATAPAPTEGVSTDKKTGVVKKSAAKTVIRRKGTEEEAAEAAVRGELTTEAAAPLEDAVAHAKAMAAEVTKVSEAIPPVASVQAPSEVAEVAGVGLAKAASKPNEVETPVVVAKEAQESELNGAAGQTIVAPTRTQPGAAATGASPARGAVNLDVAPTTVEAAVPVAAPSMTTTVTPSGPTVSVGGPGGAASAGTPARKREVVMTSSGPVSGVKSEAPRRNIVGRMDLSRVSAPQPSSGGPGASRPTGIGMGPRPGGTGGGPAPRNLRTGFVAAAPIEIEDEASAERKKFEERRRKFGAPAGPAVGGGPGGATAKEREPENITFSATEFRKREMVFQPKKKKGSLNREAKKTAITTPKASKRVVKVNETMKVADLALEMGIKAGQVVKVLMQNGMVATMNTSLDFDTISLIAPEFGFEAQNVHKTVDQLIDSTAFGDLEAERILRAPVVTIMGHVDHGKTSLLDAIRKADVASGEAGGITQHIGAYQVQTEDGHLVTFIDTPGHEAFTAMRARGANVTDIVVIVVAADDGVMPQTAEAINHAKAAEVPIIVAVNKIDKAGANPDRIKQQLTEYEIVPEEWGGSNIFVNTSALQKTGIKELLEQIYLLAEMEELRANPNRSATGVVIESRVDKGRGAVATLLVQDGTLKVGQSIVVGTVAGRVRSLVNDRGERVNAAGPSMPVEILGLSETPLAGDRFDVCVDEEAAQTVAAARKEKAEVAAPGQAKVSLEDLFSKLKQGDLKELPIILKTDVAGSSEAIKGMFEKLGTSEVKIKVIHSAVGGINESDILLASTAKGIVVGFNVRPDGGAQAAAKREGVEIKTYSIVYELMDDMKKAMGGLLAPTIVENQLGRAEVRNIFTVPKFGTIAGCFVVDGKILRAAQARLVRDGKIVYTGKISSLKRFKDDAREVASGFECGIGIENFNDVKVGDVIEAFQTESIVREL